MTPVSEISREELLAETLMQRPPSNGGYIIVAVDEREEIVAALTRLAAKDEARLSAAGNDGVREALENIEYVLRKDSLTDNERVESARIGVQRLLACPQAREAGEDK